VSQSFESFGNYILLEKLQQGGMAEIYLARRPGVSGVSKFIAIKRILPQHSEQTEFIEMFKREAKIAVNLSHANIVSIHEFGMEQNQFFIAMDFVEGKNLRQILTKMKKSGVNFSVEQVLFVIKEVAAGLDHAHRCIDANTGKPLNIIHRDISPQNVMVSFEGEVKVVDFGIAKEDSHTESTRAGTLKGKFSYMSPEQAEGQNLDLRTDIFALGIVLWELLANDRLFVANSEMNTLRKVRDCQIPSLRKVNANIPPELERIVSKALAKDRNLRYQTAAAFHRELSRFLNRQYPDFSPHDFSVFVKTLFAAEILESRKKMVEFAKLEAKNEAALVKQTAQRLAEQQQQQQKQKQPDPSSFTQNHTITESDDSDVNVSFDGKGREPAAPAAPLKSQAPPEAPRRAPPPQKQVPPIENVGRNKKVSELATPPNFINTSTLQVDRSVYRDHTNYGGTKIESSYSRSHYANSQIVIKRRLSIPVAPLFVLVIAISACLYVFGPDKSRDMVFHTLAKLGVTGKASSGSEERGKTEQSSTEGETYKLAVNTTPSGADLFIDDRAVNTTPFTVEVPQGNEVKVTIRMKDHQPYEQKLKVDKNISLNVTLQKILRVGRLDINVSGAGQIYVDGKLVAPSSPARNIMVPADREIIVRAEDPLTKASDERRITVAANETRSVTLYPQAVSKRSAPASDVLQKR
jgi:serine/threonine protein kinase